MKLENHPMKTFTRRFAWTTIGMGLTAIQCIAQSTYTPYTFSTVAGRPPLWGTVDGVGDAALFHQPFDVAVDNAGDLYVADTINNTIRKMTQVETNWMVTTLAGLAGDPGSTDGVGTAARFFYPRGLAVDNTGNVYVADFQSHVIRKMTQVGTNWMVTTLAGLAGNPGSADGIGSAARFHEPFGMAVDSTGSVYVGDYYNNTIRRMTQAGTNWTVTTLAGLAGNRGSTDAMGTEARFYAPSGVALDNAGNVYVGDHLNHTIRKMTPVGTNWMVTTLAGLALNPGSVDGTGSDARFSYPLGVAVDGAGNVYVVDQMNNEIRRVTPAGVVTTLAGLVGSVGSMDGTGSDAHFNYPAGIEVDTAGNIYVADNFNNAVRKGYPAAEAPAFIVISGPAFGLTGVQFGFNLSGPDGQSVVVEASSDLLSWLGIWTNTFAGDPLNFGDPEGGAHSNRFYRARLP